MLDHALLALPLGESTNSFITIRVNNESTLREIVLLTYVLRKQ